MEIGNRIKRARIQAGFATQRAFADELRVSSGLVGAWESHRKAPGRDNLKRIAEVTMVSMEELLGVKAPDPTPTVRLRGPDELDLLRRYRRLSPRARENLRELLGVAGDIAREIQQEREPTEP